MLLVPRFFNLSPSSIISPSYQVTPPSNSRMLDRRSRVSREFHVYTDDIHFSQGPSLYKMAVDIHSLRYSPRPISILTSTYSVSVFFSPTTDHGGRSIIVPCFRFMSQLCLRK